MNVHPMIAVGVGVVVILIGLFVFVIRPQMEESSATKNFNSPEAIAERDPANRKGSADAQAKIAEMRAKEVARMQASGR